MLVSTPPKPYMHRNPTCDSSMSPKYHRRHYTPPSSQHYDSPMLTPSPLRGRPLFPLDTNVRDSDDTLHTPYKPSALAPSCNPFYATMPQDIPADDEEGHIFLSSAASPSGTFAPLFPNSTSQPLLTPVKGTTNRTVLSARPTNMFAAPTADAHTSSRVGMGTKRKSTPHATPLRPHNLTPLKLSHSNDTDSSVLFDRLAPLAAPKFMTRTPHSKAETEAYLKRQTATLTRLRLSDPDGIDFEDGANDSGCEMDEDESANVLFRTKSRHSGKAVHHPKPPLFHATAKGKEKEEVVEAISPGGHITKRRARSRPVSAELLESAYKSPHKSPLKPVKQSGIPCRVGGTRPRHSGPVAFPTTSHRGRVSPASSSSDTGSPRPKRRTSAGAAFVRPHAGHNAQFLPPRPPLDRIESATLFFGPAIPQTAGPAPRSRTNTNLPSAPPQLQREPSFRPHLANRHSYTGPPTTSTSADSHVWNTFQNRNVSPSPGSSPFPVPDASRRDGLDMDDEDMFFAGEDSSFVLNVTRHSPSPTKVALPKKFNHRDSLLVSDEDEMPSTGSSIGGDFLSVMPKASTSVSSICSDDGLVTPGAGPESFSGWPSASIYGEDTHPYGSDGVDVDEFIMKTLAAASKGSQMPKKIPGTPVKKARISYFGNERPWQSAVASKVGLKDDCDFKKVPRKSLPAAFPPIITKGQKTYDYQPTDTEDEDEYSPSTRRKKYTGLGLGQPTQPSALNSVSAIMRRWPVVRRSSSGAFSSGSESTSLVNTPTRPKGATDWHLPKPRIPLRLSPSSDALGKASPRSTSGSSSSTVSISSPTTRKNSLAANSVPGLRHQPHLAPRPSLAGARRWSDGFTEEQQPGRFERDFDEIEEVGSGEFGKVIKVQSKNEHDGQMYAIKKSKRFEGAKHRLRLREEVDILKHLSESALSHSWVDGRHPNVLGYIDSWEEDEALYIRTELCESGNLARFLWEYGRVFPRLDEARVWKIIVDLSNGLRFIHDSSVIHLDLKPSNVFVTKEGRFKIGDFGMASLWPRIASCSESEGGRSGSDVGGGTGGGFEREGDKLYLAPEVLQGRYGKAADVFSFGMTVLETAFNIVVPDQGEAWHRLRNEDFSQVDLEHHSEVLVDLIQQMMRRDPAQRLTIAEVWLHPVVSRARTKMETMRAELSERGMDVWGASPLAGVPDGFLNEILGEEGAMDTSA